MRSRTDLRHSPDRPITPDPRCRSRCRRLPLALALAAQLSAQFAAPLASGAQAQGATASQAVSVPAAQPLPAVSAPDQPVPAAPAQAETAPAEAGSLFSPVPVFPAAEYGDWRLPEDTWAAPPPAEDALLAGLRPHDAVGPAAPFGDWPRLTARTASFAGMAAGFLIAGLGIRMVFSSVADDFDEAGIHEGLFVAASGSLAASVFSLIHDAFAPKSGLADASGGPNAAGGGSGMSSGAISSVPE